MTRGPRLRLRDQVLLASALASFALCFALHLREAGRGGFVWVPLRVEADPGAGPPRVASFWSEAVAARSGLAPGDVLLALEGRSLAGVGQLGFAARVLAQSRGRSELVASVRAGTGTREVALPLPRVPFAWRTSAIAFACVAIGALLVWRSRGFRPARLAFLALLGVGLHWSYFWGGSIAQSQAAMGVFALGAMLAAPLALRASLSFPLETASRSRVAKAWPWAFSAVGLGSASWAFGLPFAPHTGMLLNNGGALVWALLLLAILTRNFRRAGATGRRQIKWVLVGLYLGLAPPTLAASASLLEPRLAWLYQASLFSTLAIPLGLFVAVSRDHLFDVDRLITATATWSVLSVLGLASLLVAVPRVARLGAEFVDPTLAQVGLSLGVALGIVAARAWLRPRVERLVFRERAALERGAQALREALASSEKVSELFDTLGERLDALLLPSCTAVYAAAGEELAPVFVRGPAAAPSFGFEKPLAERLAEDDAVVAVPARRRHPFWRGLAPEEAAALEAMGATLLVPLRPRGALVGFVCLGEKRSGDVYTEADRALLAGIAEKASDELVRFREEELRAAERERGAHLRRYVPGAIAEQIERGGSLAPGEREVTVLFVDVRGYASFAEPRSPAEIFEAVSAYTTVVSEVVKGFGGTVVEFNGDGMMAVFGAPLALPDKERAAVGAALTIRRRVRGLRFGPEGQRVDVGVGIASGPAYVGAIHAVDRAIWSALGNTTNLAARLQALTRDLAASVAIDEATRRRAGEPARAFRSIGIVPIRGRSPLEVFALGLTEEG